MRQRIGRLVPAGMALVMATSGWADSRTLHWNELSAFVADRSVSLRLPDGSQVKGKVLAVEPDQLVIKDHKIPREQVTTLEVSRPTKRWRIVGTVVGAAVGFPVGVVSAVSKDGIFTKNNDTGIVIAIAAGLTAGGFLLGWAADRRKTTVVVVAP